MTEPNRHAINLYAGRPGAGKTQWAREEIEMQLSDKNNLVVYIGCPQDAARVLSAAHRHPGQLRVANMMNAAEAIGYGVDAANRFAACATDDPEAEQAQVTIYFDHCRNSVFYGYRDLLVAAAKAGVTVHVLCQNFQQVDKGDMDWLVQNCNCNIIAKGRAPRPASKEEIKTIYR